MKRTKSSSVCFRNFVIKLVQLPVTSALRCETSNDKVFNFKSEPHTHVKSEGILISDEPAMKLIEKAHHIGFSVIEMS